MLTIDAQAVPLRLKARFLTGFWSKMVPKILQANLIFYVVFATGKQKLVRF